MALSAHEQNLIDQLEKQFKDEDPKFAKAMEQVPARNRSALHIVTWVATVVAFCSCCWAQHFRAPLRTSWSACSVLP